MVVWLHPHHALLLSLPPVFVPQTVLRHGVLSDVVAVMGANTHVPSLLVHALAALAAVCATDAGCAALVDSHAVLPILLTVMDTYPGCTTAPSARSACGSVTSNGAVTRPSAYRTGDGHCGRIPGRAVDVQTGVCRVIGRLLGCAVAGVPTKVVMSGLIDRVMLLLRWHVDGDESSAEMVITACAALTTGFGNANALEALSFLADDVVVTVPALRSAPKALAVVKYAIDCLYAVLPNALPYLQARVR